MKRWLNFVGFFLLLIIASLAVKPDLSLFLSRQKSINPQELQDLAGDFDSKATIAIFNNQSISVPQSPISYHVSPAVLGSSTAQKRIEIDLTNQRLYAFEDNKKIFNFLISSGKWGRTPTGDFNIWIKLRYAKMEGGSKALNTYYYLPNVPYIMYFYNQDIPKTRGFGLHGTYWHDNFGHPMSHGCINMRTEDVEKLYYWAEPDLKNQPSIWASADNPGTLIRIYGEPVWE